MTIRARAGGLVACLLVLLVPAYPAAAANCDAPPTGLVPLTEVETFEGVQGGLYPDGGNLVPPDHLILGSEAAESIVPRGPAGSPDPADGRIVLVSIGVSNTLLEFRAFTELTHENPSVDPQVTLVNGGQFGRALGQWASAQSDTTWDTLDRNLEEAGVTPAQVQAAWIKLPSRSRGPSSMDEARDSVLLVTTVLQMARQRYPNLAVAYLSSRTYGGYIPDADSEPNAYLHGFEVKFVIESQIEGAAELNPDPAAGAQMVPWIAWGPYLWADGTNPRADGLLWECSDFREDGVHPADAGQQKVGAMLLEHFSTDPIASPWFLDQGQSPAAGSTSHPTVRPESPVMPRPSDAAPPTDRPDPETDKQLRNRADRRVARAASSPTEQQPPGIPMPEFGLGLALGVVCGGGVVAWSRSRRT